MQKIKKTHQVYPEKNASEVDRQTDVWTNRTDFIGLLSQRWRFDHVFQKF